MSMVKFPPKAKGIISANTTQVVDNFGNAWTINMHNDVKNMPHMGRINKGFLLPLLSLQGPRKISKRLVMKPAMNPPVTIKDDTIL